ncbi:hypothetical protein GCM10028805_35260 [Spirosoma harenae]
MKITCLSLTWATLFLGLLFLGCQSSGSEQASTTIERETNEHLSKEQPDVSVDSTANNDSDMIAWERRQQSLSQPRQPLDYIPIVRDTLMGRNVPVRTARQLAGPLVKQIGFDQYDIIDVMLSDNRDLNGDHRSDFLFTLRNGPFDGNGRGLTTLVLLSTGKNQYEGYATEPAWNGMQNELPDLDAVQFSKKNQRPYFTQNTATFPFIKL